MPKGSYQGCNMQAEYLLPYRNRYLTKIPAKVDKETKTRLAWFDYYRKAKNASLTCRHFGIPAKTFYKWKARYNPWDLTSLKSRNRRPNHFRKSKIPFEIIQTVVKIRTHYPFWSKYKVSTILKRDHKIQLSPSSVGRILKQKGLISPRESKRRILAANRKRLRVGKGLVAKNFGDIIQVDTKHLRHPTGQTTYQYIAIDCFSKLRYSKVYRTICSRNASKFFSLAREKFPFPIRAVQSDNGAEFQGEFEKMLKNLCIPHYFSYPSAPEQNSVVERAIQTDINEFYRQGNMIENVAKQNDLLAAWEETYHKIRPHVALDYLTPQEYYYKHRDKLKPNQGTKRENPKLLPMC